MAADGGRAAAGYGEPAMAGPTKHEWRRRASAARASIVIDHAAHCEVLAAHLRALRGDSASIGEPGWVVGYHAMDGEVDLAPLFAAADVGPFAVTRTPETGSALTVHPLRSPTERHRYGFLQPTAAAPVVADDLIAAVLVPGVAFDRLGGRLGRGAGYYDRFLARLDPSTPKIGITGGYVVAELPTDPHDQPMTHLCGAFGVLSVPLPDPEG